MGEVKQVMSLKLRSDEASIPKRRSGFVRAAAFSAFIIIGLFVVVSIVSSNMKINDYQKQYDDLVAQTEAVEDSNDEIPPLSRRGRGYERIHREHGTGQAGFRAS